MSSPYDPHSLEIPQPPTKKTWFIKTFRCYEQPSQVCYTCLATRLSTCKKETTRNSPEIVSPPFYYKEPYKAFSSLCVTKIYINFISHKLFYIFFQHFFPYHLPPPYINIYISAYYTKSTFIRKNYISSPKPIFQLKKNFRHTQGMTETRISKTQKITIFSDVSTTGLPPLRSPAPPRFAAVPPPTYRSASRPHRSVR